MDSATGPGSTSAEIPRTVLVVEDNALNLKLFSAMLTSLGHQVLEATDGTTGLAMAQQLRPDLIIMDIQLPGLTGLEVTQSLKADEATRKIPIIATTAFAMRGDDERILSFGCDAYMAKPIAISEFLTLVESFTRRMPQLTEFAPTAA